MRIYIPLIASLKTIIQRTTAMRKLGIGLIGTGFMGRAHALAFNNARTVFELPVSQKLAG